jgi:hypothetical protein
MARSHFFCT